MEQIRTFEQYREIVGEGKRAPDVFSNCYFLPAAVRDKIDRGVLFVERIQAGVLILEREPAFFRCYYCLSPGAPRERVHLPMPAVAELVFQNELTEKQDEQVRCLREMGFSLGRESGRMSLASREAVTQADGAVEIAEESDADAVFEMIEENFDPLYAFIGTRGELLEAIRESCVFVIRRGGAPAAALHANFSKGTACIRHLVVSETCRGHGYGRQLVSFYHRALRDRARTFSHWVSKDNAAAIALYTEFGYSFDGRYANEYVKF